MLRASLLAGLLLLAGCQQSEARSEAADRAEIHQLLVDYGATLDARDFDGFAQLFAKDGVYVAGTGDGVSGPDAGAMMERVFAENALGFREPNYHLFFNEVVTFDGPDSAHASSMSLYMVPDEAGRPSAAMMARYRDELVREGGAWKFARREVESLMPAPQAQ
ncbi:MAG TPA: nuclear transport factor 2 family protein [Sphingomonadaceae bacterium]|nr:nuclear transport factor 2 family protein [Sphingomonadaceae bacterium]